MQEKHNESTPNRPFGERPIDALMIVIDLEAYMQQIKAEDAWLKNDRNAITVFKTDVMRHVLVALHKNAVLNKDAAEGVMSLQLMEGRLNCKVADEGCELTKGQIITVAEGMPYDISATEESCFLLTMSAPL